MNPKPLGFRLPLVWIAVTLALLLLAGCASEPARQLGLSRLATGEAEKTLLAGIAHYEDGNYGPAARDLRRALDLGLKFTSDAVQAHKHLAFIHCVSGRPTSCRNAFDAALKLNPRFELSKAEAGHPMWGPVFVEAKRASVAAQR
jgi:Tfp pilus assembly protein PilF